MKSIYPSVAFRRLLRAIKTRYYQTVYYWDRTEQTYIREYLNQVLEGQDLLLWNRLGAQERAAFVAHPDSLPDNPLYIDRFNCLLQQYKQEGSAYYRFCKRAQATIRTELGVKLRQG